jgi:opacity protein-like surface antigen
MKKSILIALTACMALCALTTQAQKAVELQSGPEVIKKGNSKHAIGAVLSSVNGKGLAYRYWPDKFGLHVTFIPIATSTYEFYNTGVTGYARLKKYGVGELFMHAGAEYQYQSFEKTDYLSSFSYDSYRVNSNGVNVGFGPGYRFEYNSVSLDLFIGYGAYLTKETSSYQNASLNNLRLMTLSGGVAVFLNL